MTAKKSFLFVLLLAVALLERSTAFSFSNMVSIARPAVRIPFVGKPQAESKPAPSAGSKSLEEFNALCQKAIEDERRMHYNAYVAQACRRS